MIFTRLTLKVVPYSADSWKLLAPQWAALFRQLPDASVFLSPIWIEAWLHAFAAKLGSELLTWTNSRGECVAMCIVTVTNERIGPFQVRAAYFNATGAGAVMSEHNDLLALPEHSARVARELAAHLRSIRVEAMFLDGFRERSARALSQAFPNRRSPSSFASEDRFVPLADLRARGIAYIDSLSKSSRHAIVRSRKLLTEKYGEPVFEFAASSEAAEQFFRELRDVHSAAWRARGDEGAFASADAMRFHRGLLGAAFGSSVTAADARQVELCRMRFGDRTVGWLYCLRQGGVVSFLQSAFHYEDDNRIKPGLVTHAFAIQHYLDSGASEYDFLAGEAAPVRYKASLAAGVRYLHWDRLVARTPRMSIINVLHRCKRVLNRLSLSVSQWRGSLSGALMVNMIQTFPAT